VGRLWAAVGRGGADKSGHTLDPSISVRMALFPETCTAAMALRVCNGRFVSGPNGCAVACAQLHRIDRFIPFRGTFWMVFWEGNTGDTSDLFPDWTNPAHNETEMEEYRSRGEMGYVAEKKRLSLEFLRDQPGLYLRLTARRFVYIWTGFWSLRSDYLAGEPFAFWNIGFSTILLILMLAGIRRALYTETMNTIPLLAVLVCYPLVFYVAHAATEYRHPIDPIVVIFIGVPIAGSQEEPLRTSQRLI